MDILALAAAGATTPEPDNSPQTAQPGFDQALSQAAKADEGPPTAGPPGPEPPPGIKPAGEGVTSNEPNALSKTPDFLPLPEVDVKMPAPFWNEVQAVAQADPKSAGTKTDAKADRKTAEQAMSLVVSQMVGGLFATPQAANPSTPTISIGAVAATTGNAKAPTQAAVQLPIVPATTGQTDLPKADAPKTDIPVPAVQIPIPAVANQQAPVPAKPAGSQPLIGTQPQIDAQPSTPKPEAPKLVSDEASKFLNVQSVTTDAPQTPTPAVPITPQAAFVQPAADAPAAKQSDAPAKAEAPVIAVAPAIVPDKEPVQAPTTPVVAATVVQPEAVKQAAPKTADTPKPAKAVKTDQPRATDAPEAPKETAANTAQQDTGKDTPKDSKAQTTQDVKVAAPKAQVKDEPAPVDPVDKDTTTPTVQAAPTREVTTSGTAPAKADAPLAPKEVDLVVKQVADRMQMLAAARPKNGVTIHLSPDDLGTVTVVIKAVGQQVSTDLFASDDRVRNALDQNQTRLSDALGSRGFQLQSVSVSQQSSHSTYSQNQQNSQGSQNQQATQNQTNGQAQQNRQNGRQQGQNQTFSDKEDAPTRWTRLTTNGVDIAI